MNNSRGGAKALILEERHMISILMFLGENNGCTKSELYRGVSSNPRMPEKLDILESAGLLTQQSEAGSRAVRLFLTEPGSKVCSELERINSVMPEQEP